MSTRSNQNQTRDVFRLGAVVGSTSSKILKQLWCLATGHQWKVVSRTSYKIDVQTCLEQSNPFALVTCSAEEEEVEGVKAQCICCKRTISYEQWC